MKIPLIGGVTNPSSISLKWARFIFKSNSFYFTVRIGSAKERELDAILKKYTKSFKRILAFSKTNSILDLVDKYHHMDQDNFQDFKYITELNNEVIIMFSKQMFS